MSQEKDTKIAKLEAKIKELEEKLKETKTEANLQKENKKEKELLPKSPAQE